MPYRFTAWAAALLCLCTGTTDAADANPPPHLHAAGAHTEPLVHRTPLLLGGQLAHSSAATAAAAARVLPALARRGFNTTLMPVSRRQIEPRPGHFEFETLNHWITRARTLQLHLGVLWIGSWKNALCGDAPAWVLGDPDNPLRGGPPSRWEASRAVPSKLPTGADLPEAHFSS